jgi:hypothetical protein
LAGNLTRIFLPGMGLKPRKTSQVSNTTYSNPWSESLFQKGTTLMLKTKKPMVHLKRQTPKLKEKTAKLKSSVLKKRTYLP